MEKLTTQLLTGVLTLGLLTLTTQAVTNKLIAQVQLKQRLSFNRGGSYTIKLTRLV